jgi:hypothetical protein
VSRRRGAAPGTVRFVDDGRALLWLDDADALTVHLFDLARETLETMPTTGLTPLADDTGALLERSGGVDLIRWRGRARRPLLEGEAHVDATSARHAVLSVRDTGDRWRLVVQPL